MAATSMTASTPVKLIDLLLDLTLPNLNERTALRLGGEG
jgi:hypothetical protein